jgi:hypothetical protein
MLAEDGTLARTGRWSELLAVIGRYGHRALTFVWRNKGALTVTTVVTAFLDDPEPFRTARAGWPGISPRPRPGPLPAGLLDRSVGSSRITAGCWSSC